MTNEELVDRIQHGINKEEYLGQLYILNRGFIATVIRKYRYACRSDYNSLPIIEMDELMHEAYFGLIEAADRFNPEQGNTFITYAAYWINKAVKSFLDNSGQMIRIPVHTQERIYKYNQATGYYLRNYNRFPDIWEYASWIDISPDGVKKLEQFMYQGAILSLDETVPGGEEDNLSFADVVPADVDIEENVVEKLASEQIREELWKIVVQVLKDEKMVDIIHYRFIDGLTLEEIGIRLNITRDKVRDLEAKGLKRLRCNSRTKLLGQDLGMWNREFPINACRVKLWTEEGKLEYLNKNELKYAANMGWVDNDLI